MKKSIYVVTGAARGIGFELARQTVAQGHTVIVGVRRPQAATDLNGLAAQSEGRLKVLELDVSSDSSVEQFHRLVAKETETIDVLINNAGIYNDAGETFESITSSKLSEAYNTNAIGPVRVTQALLPLLRNAKLPVVACISSLMGSLADNSGGSSYAYRMSKAALNMFVRSFSVDEREIIALTLHPGWVKTEMGGARAPLAPEKSAEGLLVVIQSASTEDSGKFLNHAGRELPW